MKHVFILSTKSNPEAFTKKFIENIKNTCKKAGEEFIIKMTEKAADAEKFAREYAAKGGHRIYACGGDGTVNEVANGLFGYPDTEFAVVPIGTGNDFVKTFGGLDIFLNIEQQLKSKSTMIDAIKINDRLCVNIANIGFDSTVVKYVEKIRKKKFIPKKFAYPIGVLTALITFPKEHLKIELDNGEVIDRKFLLSLFANAQYYGGGYKSGSPAKVDDGLMDFITVNDVSRLKFIKHVSAYQKGTIIGTPAGNEFIEHRQVKKLTLSKSVPFDLCYDGEFITATKTVLECIPHALRLVIPNGAKDKKTDCFLNKNAVFAE